jgi:hypothetical protein
MNSFERAARNSKIVALRARGLSEQSIADKYQIDRIRVRQIMDDWKATEPTLRTVDPLKIIDDMLVGYQADLEHLAEVADNAMGDNARVGAINARMAARDRIIALLQTTGVLPHDLGKLKVEVDVRFIAQKMVSILSANHVPDIVQKELLEALQSGAVLPDGDG